MCDSADDDGDGWWGVPCVHKGAQIIWFCWNDAERLFLAKFFHLIEIQYFHPLHHHHHHRFFRFHQWCDHTGGGSGVVT